MPRRLTRHMRHNVVAYLALFFALTGTAVAAAPLMTGAKIENGTINSDDLRDRGSAAYPGPSIQGKDVEANTLGGDEILESSLGKVRAADTLDGRDSSEFLRQVRYVNGPVETLAPWEVKIVLAECPSGSRVIGGGYNTHGGNVREMSVGSEMASGGWRVGVVNLGDNMKGTDPLKVSANAMCAFGGT